MCCAINCFQAEEKEGKAYHRGGASPACNAVKAEKPLDRTGGDTPLLFIKFRLRPRRSSAHIAGGALAVAAPAAYHRQNQHCRMQEPLALSVNMFGMHL
jgi:hypothetical protein